MAQAIGLLSGYSQGMASKGLSFSTDGKDSFTSPAAYKANTSSWVHVFPEACCHQSQESGLRYFKWGISRLILESDPAPEFIPMFIHGTQDIMPEDRGFPRFLPRIGNKIRVVIGEPARVDTVFGRQRAKWKQLVDKGDPDLLTHGREVVQLRIQVAKLVRDEVAKLRESIGLPPEQDETAALAETWSKEPNKRKFKSPVDGSLVNRV
ncbi:tafazzin [Metarhizium album ARSEF 1941]|uniref:Tafazzin family protein n=1 Tax=Metarhizium album (strain ARSEF 1941) TaxID=1081103 RepID=A0A0B2WX96_METAS|nr:tafazzin [Metarhizium album ARSEF 1941]KHO00867.1 tafazzin [Metarhizium album ARSEF 1941]